MKWESSDQHELLTSHHPQRQSIALTQLTAYLIMTSHQSDGMMSQRVIEGNGNNYIHNLEGSCQSSRRDAQKVRVGWEEHFDLEGLRTYAVSLTRIHTTTKTTIQQRISPSPGHFLPALFVFPDCLLFLLLLLFRIDN